MGGIPDPLILLYSIAYTGVAERDREKEIYSKSPTKQESRSALFYPYYVHKQVIHIQYILPTVMYWKLLLAVLDKNLYVRQCSRATLSTATALGP
jgi:hypothetical protein